MAKKLFGFQQLRRAFRNLSYILLMYISSISLTFYNKWLLKVGSFPCICKVFDLPCFKPFILNIRKLILLSYDHKLLCWLVLKIYCDIKTNIPFVENFLRFHYLSGKYCLKIVWRFYLLITVGSERIKIWYYVLIDWVVRLHGKIFGLRSWYTDQGEWGPCVMSQMFSCLTQPNSVNEHISDKH